MDKLKPCPFCGGMGRLLYIESIRRWAVECEKYGHLHNTWTQPARKEAIDAWNRRTDNG